VPLTKALENVSKLSLDDLPVIPGYSDAPENYRRLAALHRELSRLSGNSTYFLSYRDAADVSDELFHQTAHTITFALVRLEVVEIVNKGQPNPKGGKAAEFRYLFPEIKNVAEKDDDEIAVRPLSRARGTVARRPENRHGCRACSRLSRFENFVPPFPWNELGGPSTRTRLGLTLTISGERDALRWL
jgi:hypothetical protein